VTTTAERTSDAGAFPARSAPAPAAGLKLLGPLKGTGYSSRKFLLQRDDGQVLQVGPLMYQVLECMDGRRGHEELAGAVSATLARPFGEDHLARVLEKLSAQGLLAGTEAKAPPKRNPLLALRWRLLITNPRVTRLLSAPFTFMFRPWVMWPVLAAFVAVCWYVLVEHGVAAAIAQSFHQPALLLLVFALAVISAGFHELGHAAACRYGGVEPRGMGVGLYLVWPAFYTDVTDAYRLDRRGRLRVDLAGLYFNAAVAVVTMAVWVVVRLDALLLLVALQVLQMVKQLSPIIRADGYHILSDATGVPDLYAHMGPTLRRLVPGRPRPPSPVKGWARVLVTAWVLVIVPVLLSLLAGAVVFLPRLLTSAWDSGRHIADGLPAQFGHADVLGFLATLLELLALVLPLAGSVLITQKFVRSTYASARRWSRGRPPRQATALIAAAVAACGLAWAWWPSGQYQPVRPSERGNIASVVRALSPAPAAPRPAGPALAPGTYLAAAMVPVGGAKPGDPAVLVLPGPDGHAPTMLLSDGTAARFASAFHFVLPPKPGPGGTQAVALGTRGHKVTYDVAYAVVTVRGGRPVTESNSAFALADCQGCTTVAVSFQVVLVVGTSKVVAPTNAAVAANDNCPACSTTAIADQLVVTLDKQPTAALERELESTLSQLKLLSKLGSHGTTAAVAALVAKVNEEVDAELKASGIVASPATTTSATTSATTSGNGSATQGASGSSAGSTATSTAPSSTSTASTTTTTTPSSTTTTTTPSSTTTTTSAGTSGGTGG
jgi:putative peptide zinc metalloprotease protein